MSSAKSSILIQSSLFSAEGGIETAFLMSTMLKEVVDAKDDLLLSRFNLFTLILVTVTIAKAIKHVAAKIEQMIIRLVRNPGKVSVLVSLKKFTTAIISELVNIQQQ